MTGLGLSFLLCLTCLSLCEGEVFPPSAGTSLTFARGSTGRILWSFDDVISAPTDRRIWSFTSNDAQSPWSLAIIDGVDGPVKILTNIIDFAVEKPATLVLKNVNITYNGTYQFGLIPSSGAGSSEVVVYIAVTPWVKVNCHSPSTVNVTGNFTCLCEASGGNPTAYVTWYKGNKKFGELGKEEQTLHLINVRRNDAGIYNCEAKSHDSAINITEVELIINYPPENVMLKLTRSDKSVTITCSAEAQPSASYKIFVNETELVSTHKTCTIPELNVSHVGNYTCVAKNILGSKTSNSKHLFFIGAPSTTHSTTILREKVAKTTRKRNETKTASSNDTSCQTEWYIVVVTLVAGIIIGILFSYIVFCSRGKFKSSNTANTQFSNEPRTTEVDTTYQELDLTKMNKEDNYQSLRVNAASGNVVNDDDSNYSELSKTRDVENNYQSLT